MKKQQGKPKNSATLRNEMGEKRKSTLHPSDMKLKNKKFLDDEDDFDEEAFDKSFSNKITSFEDFDDDFDDEDDDY